MWRSRATKIRLDIQSSTGVQGFTCTYMSMKRSKTVVSFKRAKLVCFWYWSVRSSSSIKSTNIGTRVTLSFRAVTKFTGKLHNMLKNSMIKIWLPALKLRYLRQAMAGKSAIESSLLAEIFIAWMSSGKSGDSMNCSQSFDFSPWCFENKFPTIERWKAENIFFHFLYEIIVVEMISPKSFWSLASSSISSLVLRQI